MMLQLPDTLPILNESVSAQWFFGSVAVLFIGLLVYNLLEMKHAIKALTSKTHTHDMDIALLKQEAELQEEKFHRNEDVMESIDNHFKRLNQTLTLLTTERTERKTR